MYISTRNHLNKVKASMAIIKGISDDGGLFIKENYDDFCFDKSDLNLSYQELSIKILKYFLDDFSISAIKDIVYKAYSKSNFEDNIINVKNFSSFSLLELFHGPTLAFKDMALTMLPLLLDEAKRINNYSKKSLILTATSGDTGSAALSGFKTSPNSHVIVLYPNEAISEIQEKQMLYYAKQGNNYALSINSNFDECQNIVKELFNDKIDIKNYELTSANSINIGRLLPQIIYYFKSYFDMVNKHEIKFGEVINVVVPTGNFGNVLALYMAKKMGLFINKLVVATNKNNVLTDFFKTGIYDSNREFYNTLSPSMDILISSNIERLLYLITLDDTYVKKMMKDLKEVGKYQLDKKYLSSLNDFISIDVSDVDTVNAIKDCYDNYDYIIDPHTAVAYFAMKKLNLDRPLVVATASPYKFLPVIKQAIEGVKLDDIPDNIKKLDVDFNQRHIINKEKAKEEIRKIIGEIDALC